MEYFFTINYLQIFKQYIVASIATQLNNLRKRNRTQTLLEKLIRVCVSISNNFSQLRVSKHIV